MSKKNNPIHSTFWIASLVIQSIAVLLYFHMWVNSIAYVIHPLTLGILCAYLPSLVLTIKLIRNKSPSEANIAALAVLNIIAALLSIAFIIFAVSIFSELLSR